MAKSKNTDLVAARKAKKQAERIAKWQAKQSQKILKEQIKKMRPYMASLKKIDLRHNISRGQKSFITKAWNEFDKLTSRPTKIYRTKDKKKLKLAKEFSVQELEKGSPKFDVAFIPAASPKVKVKINPKTKEMTLEYKHVRERKKYFDREALVANPDKEIQRILDETPNAKKYVMMVKEFLYNGPIARSLIIQETKRLMERYSPGGENYGKQKGIYTGKDNHYKHWLFGLMAYEAVDQKAINEYNAEYHKARRKKLEDKKKDRERRKYKYGRKF
jgi:hypothetical protein